MYKILLGSDGQSLLASWGPLKGFIFDENVPRQLQFQPSLPYTHVSDLNRGLSDGEIWTYARVNELVIVTKDADFSNRIMVNESPPWVVHLRFGNMRLREFHAFLAKAWPMIEALLPANKLAHVHVDRLEAIR